MEKYIDTLIKIFPMLVAVAGGLWTLNTYFDNQRQASQIEQAARAREERNQLLQAQQPFLEHRWKAYIETSSVAGALVVLDTADPGWTDARKRFWELYWSELAMVETPDVGLRHGRIRQETECGRRGPGQGSNHSRQCPQPTKRHRPRAGSRAQGIDPVILGLFRRTVAIEAAGPARPATWPSPARSRGSAPCRAGSDAVSRSR